MKWIIDLIKRLSDRWYLETKEDWTFSFLALLNISVGYIFIIKGAIEFDSSAIYKVLGIIISVDQFGKFMLLTGLILIILTAFKPSTLHKYLFSMFATICSTWSFFLYAMIVQAVGKSLSTPVILLIISIMSFALFILEGVRLCQHLIQNKKVY